MHVWTFLVAQWMRIHLSVQGTWAQGDPTCCRATKSLYHNNRAHRLQPQKPTCSGAHKLNDGACMPQLVKSACLCSATREATAMRKLHGNRE